VPYYDDCLLIRSNGRVLGFYTVVPPQSYFATGTFSADISAVFTQTEQMEITNSRDQSAAPNIPLQPGCTVRPLE
jgi:hypothetical protein